MKNHYNKTAALKVVLYEMWAMNKNIIISIPIIVFVLFAGAGFWPHAPFHEQFIDKTDPNSDSFYKTLLDVSSNGKIFSLLTIPFFLTSILRGYLIHINEHFNTLTYPIRPFERVLGICLFSVFTYLLNIVSIILFDNLLVALYKHLYLDDTIAYLERQGQFYNQFGEYSLFNTLTTTQLSVFSTIVLMSIPFYALFIYMFKKYATLVFVTLGIAAYIFLMTFTVSGSKGNSVLILDGTVVTLWRYVCYSFFVFMILLSFYYKLKEKEH